MHYKLIYDITQTAPAWWFPAVGLIFVTIGALLVIFRKRAYAYYSSTHLSTWGYPPLWNETAFNVFSVVWLGGGIAWTAAAGWGIFSDYYALKTAVERREYQVVEGKVENFRPMPHEGGSLESFTVNGKEFEYSDFVMRPGFKNTQSYGGPIHEGLFVRIGYIENQTTCSTRDIVRLEINE